MTPSPGPCLESRPTPLKPGSKHFSYTEPRHSSMILATHEWNAGSVWNAKGRSRLDSRAWICPRSSWPRLPLIQSHVQRRTKRMRSSSRIRATPRSPPTKNTRRLSPLRNEAIDADETAMISLNRRRPLPQGHRSTCAVQGLRRDGNASEDQGVRSGNRTLLPVSPFTEKNAR